MTIVSKLVTPFQINSVQNLSQLHPSTAALKDGGYVVAWDANVKTATSENTDIYAQRYDAAGAPVGDAFLVNTVTAQVQVRPSVSALENGGFVVGWQTGKGLDINIAAQVYSASGAKAGAEIQANTVTINQQEFPHIVGLSNGGFAAVWSTEKGVDFGGNPVSDVYGVELQFFSAKGIKAGAEVNVISTPTVPTNKADLQPFVTELSNGNVLVSWRQISEANDATPTESKAFGQIYTSAGAKVGSQIDLAAYPLGATNTNIVALDNGGFVVSASTANLTKFSIFDSAGAKNTSLGISGNMLVGDPNTSNSSASGSESAMAIKQDGSLLFAYKGHDGYLYTQQFDTSTGLAKTDLILIDNTTSAIDDISLNVLADGGYTITWSAKIGAGALEIYGAQFNANDEALTKVLGTSAADTLNGTASDEFLLGYAGNDTIDAGAGNDVIDGGAGNDSLIGGAGNDTYIVDTASDQIVEDADNGIDTVNIKIATAKGSYTLADKPNLENVSLLNTVAFNLTGNDAANLLIGNDAANVLDGGAGADTLVGGAGADIFIIDNLGDVITESALGGVDKANINIDVADGSYTLGDEVETGVLINTVAFSLTGNAIANTLTGNAAANTLDGAAGKDTLTGGDGNDTYIVDIDMVKGKAVLQDVLKEGKTAASGNDTIELRGTLDLSAPTTLSLAANFENLDASLTTTTKLNLTGSAVANSIIGNEVTNKILGLAGNDDLSGGGGDDSLNGGVGLDTLTGGTGNDYFIFDSKLGATNIDTISDFTAGDHIELSRGIFKKLAVGSLSADNFGSGADDPTNATLSSKEYVYFNTTNHGLFYDADGSGKGLAVKFATLTDVLDLTAADFIVIK